MKENKFLSGRSFHLASALAVLALFLFVLAGLSPGMGMRIFLGILCALSLVTGVVIIYLSHRAKGERYHYFLQDHRRGISIKPEDMTAEVVLEGTRRYLSAYVKDPITLWREIPKPLRIQLEQDVGFRPLISYLMLLSLSKLESDELMEHFAASDPRAVGYLCQSLATAGDEEMADYIHALRKNTEHSQRICAFFHKNRRRFEGRMLRFVEENMSDFYRNKSKKSDKKHK